MNAEFKTRLKFRIVALTAFLAVPFCMAGYLWGSTPPWGAAWFTYFVIAHVVVGYLFVAGNWSWVGYPLRWEFPLLVLYAAYNSAGPRGLLLSAVTFGVLTALPAAYYRVTSPRTGAVDFTFPLRNGIFYVAHGGQASFMNRHNTVPSQKYALDILRLKGFLLTRASRLYSPNLGDYYTYGAAVSSPCDGVVTHVTDIFPDLVPPLADRANPLGNHVIIQVGNAAIYVGLAHLQHGSIAVRVGDQVSAGRTIARAGNSGNSTEPHLHIQAKKGGDPDLLLDGKGLPMLFDGQFLLRNDLVRPKAVVDLPDDPTERIKREL